MKFIFFSLVAFSQVPCLAGSFIIGNGGGGVRSRLTQDVYLLDFAEAGIEESAFITCSENLFTEQVKKALGTQNMPNNEISCKLSEIFEIDKVLAHSLLVTIQSFSWTFVDHGLSTTPDINTSLDMTNFEYTQLANRRFSQILLNSSTWKDMSNINKTGLIIHEAVYALLGHLDLDSSTKNAYARTLVAFLFSLNRNKSLNLFYDKTKYLPTIKIVNSSLPGISSYFLTKDLPEKSVSAAKVKMAPVLNLNVNAATYRFQIPAIQNHDIDYKLLALNICKSGASNYSKTSVYLQYSGLNLLTSSSDDKTDWSINIVTAQTSKYLNTVKICKDEDLTGLQLVVTELLKSP